MPLLREWLTYDNKDYIIKGLSYIQGLQKVNGICLLGSIDATIGAIRVAIMRL